MAATDSSSVRWIRDHVHVMKAMKYLVPEISSFWQFYMETQTEEGLFYDYYYPIEDRLNYRLNLFDNRYWQIFPGDAIQMLRLPVEADLEYLMVEGAFYIWQLGGPNNVVLTVSACKKYFGADSPLGKTLIVGNDDTEYKITGVVRDYPANSQIKFDFLASFSSLRANQEETYFDANYTTYILLHQDASLSELQKKFAIS